MAETKLSDKPYAFVPLQPVKRDARVVQNTRIDKNWVSGILSFECFIVTPLHIGNGKIRLISDETNRETEMLHPTVTYKGKPVIPGSTFKGMLRAVYETFTRSCMVFSPTKQDQSLSKGMPIAMQGTCRGEQACPACSVFGSLGWRGKIRIPDLELVEGGTEEIHMPTFKKPFTDYPACNEKLGNARLYYAHEGNDGLGQDSRRPQPQFGDMSKDDFYKKFGWNKGPTTICFYGRKFYKLNLTKPQAGKRGAWNKVQAVTKGSVFKGRIIMEGLTQMEWKDLLIALGLGHDNWHHQLGQGKPAYYGTVQIRSFSFQPAKRFGESPDNLNKLIKQEDELRQVAVSALNGRDLSQREALAALTDILSNPNGGPAWKEIEGDVHHRLGY